jgi:ketosteroid isomerase-like protein
MNRLLKVASTFLALAITGSMARADEPPGRLEQQVADVERAFAATMRDRDHAAFVGFLSEEAVFFNGDSELRGRAAVAAAWKGFFAEGDAPFSWEPATVAVLDSGTLALSSGPVRDPDGRQVAIFTSIWRQEAPGVWRIIFDKGASYCE